MMNKKIGLPLLPQPNDSTCGPTCLHAIYNYYGDTVSLDEVIAEVATLEEGGTLAVMLGCHALRRGYKAVIYSYNLQVFDPTWFVLDREAFKNKLSEQMKHKPSPKLQIASTSYLEFLALGGEIRMEDLTVGLIRDYLTESVPIITGLSATYLYRKEREHGPESLCDDIRGVPSGHFVVLTDFDDTAGEVHIADPYLPNPNAQLMYSIRLEHLLCSILLGVVTYDANLLIITQ
jgi:hypothetical protein